MQLTSRKERLAGPFQVTRVTTQTAKSGSGNESITISGIQSTNAIVKNAETGKKSLIPNSSTVIASMPLDRFTNMFGKVPSVGDKLADFFSSSTQKLSGGKIRGNQKPQSLLVVNNQLQCLVSTKSLRVYPFFYDRTVESVQEQLELNGELSSSRYAELIDDELVFCRVIGIPASAAMQSRTPTEGELMAAFKSAHPDLVTQGYQCQFHDETLGYFAQTAILPTVDSLDNAKAFLANQPAVVANEALIEEPVAEVLPF